jgi:hypothetical protein
MVARVAVAARASDAVQLVHCQLVSLRHGGHNPLGRVTAALFGNVRLPVLP